MDTKAFTQDTFFKGKLRIKQERAGYRFSIDAVLLVHHVRPRPAEIVLDLGSGCGIIPLILAYRYPNLKIFGVEVQTRLARLATANVELNQMQERISILSMDMRAVKARDLCGPVDVAVSNPPYRRAASGRINPDPQKAVAMHEIKTSMYHVVDAARRTLRTGGRLVTIYPAERTTDILTQFRSLGIEPKQMRMIHSFAEAEAKFVIVEGVKGGGPGMKVTRPLYLYQADGSYSREVEKMLAPD